MRLMANSESVDDAPIVMPTPDTGGWIPPTNRHGTQFLGAKYWPRLSPTRAGSPPPVDPVSIRLFEVAGATAYSAPA
jgi:hypothetical protein